MRFFTSRLRLLPLVVAALLSSPAFVVVGVTATSTTTTGCTSDSTCEDTNPAVKSVNAAAFAKDVFPIFKTSCAFASCHGSSTGTSNGVFLGGDNPATVHLALVNVRSSKLQSMSYVKPGEPHESFLMRKLDGSQCVLDGQCDKGECGQSMPRNDETLDEDTRDVIRRWIVQGAKND